MFVFLSTMYMQRVASPQIACKPPRLFTVLINPEPPENSQSNNIHKTRP